LLIEVDLIKNQQSAIKNQKSATLAPEQLQKP
jgi:hypothetical protein